MAWTHRSQFMATLESRYSSNTFLPTTSIEPIQSSQPGNSAYPSVGHNTTTSSNAQTTLLESLKVLNVPVTVASEAKVTSTEVRDLPKIRQTYAPPPLPARRKRTLTLPLPPFNSSSRSQRRQWTSEQAHCLFFQILPYDIRRIVYEYILADKTFHIIRLRKKLRHVECAKEQRSGVTCWGMSSVDGTLIRDLEKKLLGRRLLNMLRTCRRVYTEAIGVLYSRNKFDVNGPETMISLSQTLLPHRLDAIRSLQLTWAFFHPAHTVYDGDKILLTGDEALWKVCWAVVGGMKGVSDIRIWLSMSPAVEAARQPEEDLLEPLKEIGLKKRIEVRVSWTLPKPEVRSWGEYPFRLIRLPEEDWGATCLQQQAG